MTPFNPENKEELTYGESLGPAMEITQPEDAKQYLDQYVHFIQDWRLRQGKPLEERTYEAVLRDCLHNLGYYAGYYGTDVQQRVQELFHAYHPIFGPV